MSTATGTEPATTTAVPYVDIHETHTGVVVLAGDRAFKAKKPVLTDFLDFRTPEQRERACRREVELNSRLSPDSYLGVAHLSDPAGGPAEPIIVMRRYNDDDRLASMVARGPDDSVYRALDAIAVVLARFHRGAERNGAVNAQGEVAAIEQRWRENLSELNRYAGAFPADSLPHIQRLATQFLSGRAALFERPHRRGMHRRRPRRSARRRHLLGGRPTGAARLPGVRRQPPLRRLRR